MGDETPPRQPLRPSVRASVTLLAFYGSASFWAKPLWAAMGWTTDAALGPAPLTAQELFPHVQRLRGYAVNKKLDMTDSFEEYCAAGYDKNVGIMDTQR